MDDPDRAAILARRQRFIALALSGLAVACGDDGKGPSPTPMPCLDVGPVTTSSAEDDGNTLGMTGQIDGTSSGTASGSDGASTSGSDGPTTNTSSSDGSATSSGTSNGTGDGTDTDAGSTGQPLPCLGVMP